MRTAFPNPSIVLLALAFVVYGQNALGQNSQTQPPPRPTNTSQPSTAQQPHQSSPADDAGGGTGDIGKGTAGNVGKGGAVAGKDVGVGGAIGVGAAKGTGKIAEGTGRGIGKIFHHHHEKAPAPSEPQNRTTPRFPGMNALP